MDNLTKEQRRKNMQAIKSTGTSIETILAKALWKKGYRYRKNCKNITGKPDIVLRKHKLAIFCDSEFWHGKDHKNTLKKIGTNQKYWIDKIKRNIRRDKKINKILHEKGWTVLRFWGKDINNNLDICLSKIESVLRSSSG